MLRIIVINVLDLMRDTGYEIFRQFGHCAILSANISTYFHCKSMSFLYWKICKDSGAKCSRKRISGSHCVGNFYLWSFNI